MLAKTKLNSIEALISKSLIDSYISQDEFVLINNTLNELTSKKHKKVSKILNYIEDFLNLASAVTGCFPVSTFASLPGIDIRITSAAIRLKIGAIIAAIEKFNPIIKKKQAW